MEYDKTPMRQTHRHCQFNTRKSHHCGITTLWRTRPETRRAWHRVCKVVFTSNRCFLIQHSSFILQIEPPYVVSYIFRHVPSVWDQNDACE